MKTAKAIFGILILVVASAAAFADSTGTTHIYNLAGGSYTDQLGGPSLVSNGGTLSSSGYSFSAGQGLNLSSGVNATNYSVELVFSLNSVSSPDGWAKLLDFKGLSADTGLYVTNGLVQFWPTFASSGNMSADSQVNLILTRDGATNQVVIYLNGVAISSFVDSWGLTTLSNNGLFFFQDDNTTGGMEATSGNVSLIRTYDGALSQSQVTFVDDARGTLAPSPTPEPASLLLIGAGLAALGGLKKRRR